MKFLFFPLVSLLVVSSCSSENGEKKIISVEKKVVYKPTVKVNADRKLAVEVSGMTCEHACGGSIRMALKETNAVDRVSFDFETDRKVNTAFITFDKSKISADEIVAIIEKINDKQFTTGKVSSEAVETKATEGGTSSNSTSSSEVKPKIEVSTTTNFEMPNLFELFSKIIS
jgi:copper chaperone CopZ